MTTTAPESMTSGPEATPAFYVTGGTLGVTAPSYVERRADHDLLGGLTAGEFCYVLNSRQMGKSSLCVRTMARLREMGHRTCFLDLTKFGGRNLSAEQWYAALLSEAGRELSLRSEMLAFWKQNTDLGPMQRLFGAIQQVALPASESPLTVFVDEIDVTRGLPFSADEFFAGVRQCYVGRATDPALNRLTVCLLGTATPTDLIQDTRTSPFNIGRRIEVQDFTPEEAAPLAAGLGANGPALLSRVLYWTGGHPYLTQRLCRAAQESGPKTTAEVDRLCSDLFLTRQAADADDNLAFVRNRLLKSEVDLAGLLELYGQMRRGRRVPDDEADPLCAVLKLSGVARTENGTLHVRNRIYEHVFSREWIVEHTPGAELRRQREAYRQGLIRAGTIAACVVLVVSLLALLALSAFRNARSAALNATRSAAAKSAAQRQAEIAEGQAQWSARRSAALAKKNGALAVKNGALAKNNGALATSLRGALTAETAQTHSALAAKADALRQRQIAIDAKDDALHAKADALAEKSASDRNLSAANRNLYAADMSETQQAWENNSIEQAVKLLHETQAPQYRPYQGFEWGYWNRMCHLNLVTLRNHTSHVRSAAFSPDGRRIVTASLDKTAKVWDAATGHLLLTLMGHKAFVHSAAFSPDGRRIVTASLDKTAKVWDAATGHLLLTFTGHTGYVLSAAYSPDGTRIVTASGDRMSFTDQIGGGDNTAKIWDARTGRLLLTLKKDVSKARSGLGLSDAGTLSAAFSPDGTRIVTANADGTARVWDAATGHELPAFTVDEDIVRSAAFSPDGKRIVTVGSWDGTVKVWDAQTGHEILKIEADAEIINPARSHAFSQALSAAFSPDGTRIVTGNEDNTAEVWDAATGHLLLTLMGHTGYVPSAAYSPDGRRIVTASDDGTARVWDAQTERETLTLTGHKDALSTAAFSPDGRRIVTASHDKTAEVWDAATGHLLLTLTGHKDALSTATFSPDGRRIVTASWDNTAKVWDATTGHLLLNLRGHNTGSGASWDVSTAAYSPDGRRIVTAGNDHTARVWDAQTGRELLTLNGYAEYISDAAYSPDGRRIVTVCSDILQITGGDYTARVWDSRTGLKVLTLTGHTAALVTAAFSPDGRRIVTASTDKTAKVWDATTGHLLHTLMGHTADIWNAAFSPDGKRIVTASNDRTTKVWDTATGRVLLTITGHKGDAQYAAFSPDGRRIVTTSNDSVAKAWAANIIETDFKDYP